MTYQLQELERERGGTDLGAAPSACSGELTIDQCVNRVRVEAAIPAAPTHTKAIPRLNVRWRINLIERAGQ